MIEKILLTISLAVPLAACGQKDTVTPVPAPVITPQPVTTPVEVKEEPKVVEPAVQPAKPAKPADAKKKHKKAEVKHGNVPAK